MKIFSFLILGLFLTVNQAQADSTGNDSKSSESIDAEYTELIKKIEKKYAKDKEFLAKFKVANQKWNEFVKAHIDSIYPKVGKPIEYGSAYPMCYSNAKSDLFKTRIKQLKKWVDGTEEGDVCSGSVHTRK